MPLLISKNLVLNEKDQLMLGGANIPPASTVSPSFSLYLPNVDLKATTDVQLLKTPSDTDKYLYLTKIDFVLMAVDKLTLQPVTGAGVPIVSIGFTSPFNQLAANYALTGLKDVRTTLAWVVSGISPGIAPNTAVVLRKNTVANAKSYLVGVRILGYYF